MLLKVHQRLILSILMLTVSFSLVACHHAQEKGDTYINSEVVARTANHELPHTLEKIPISSENLYGFNNRDEFGIAKVENPFQMYTLDGDIIRETKSFRVPISVESEFRALATVEIIHDTLHIVDFGATQLAKEIQLAIKSNPELSFVGILRVYSIFSDFLIMTKNQEYQFIPLTSAKTYLQNNRIKILDKSLSKNQLLDILKKK